MIFMAKVCPKAMNFATAESIHQLLALMPHPTQHRTALQYLCFTKILATAGASYGMTHDVSQ